MRQYEEGNRDVIGALRIEEANLLRARQQARAHGWWRQIIGSMQGLRRLYDHTGRRSEWQRLVEEIVPDFIDPETEGPLLNREDDWGLVTDYRVRLAQEERKWGEAERLQLIRLASDRQRAAPVLSSERRSLHNEKRLLVRTLAVSLEGLGSIQRALGREDCFDAYKEALELSESIGDQAEAAVCALNLGHAYEEIPSLRDLRQSQHWYRRSLELTDERDRMWQGKCLAQLGFVAHEKFNEAREHERPVKEALEHLSEAADYYHQALEHLPEDAVDELAVAHGSLGIIYSDAVDQSTALAHFSRAIRYREIQGDAHSASLTRRNIAVTLVGAGRLEDALEYARTALRGFESYGDSAADDIQKTRHLIEIISRQL